MQILFQCLMILLMVLFCVIVGKQLVHYSRITVLHSRYKMVISYEGRRGIQEKSYLFPQGSLYVSDRFFKSGLYLRGVGTLKLRFEYSEVGKNGQSPLVGLYLTVIEGSVRLNNLLHAGRGQLLEANAKHLEPLQDHDFIEITDTVGIRIYEVEA